MGLRVGRGGCAARTNELPWTWDASSIDDLNAHPERGPWSNLPCLLFWLRLSFGSGRLLCLRGLSRATHTPFSPHLTLSKPHIIVRVPVLRMGSAVGNLTFPLDFVFSLPSWSQVLSHERSII
jgi:hypothetical protein